MWKVSALDADARSVQVQHAAPRDDVTEDMTMAQFLDRCAEYFSARGMLIDQPFASRLAEGMIRAYLVEQEVVGFASQQPTSRKADAKAPDPTQVLGMPSAKTMYDADAPEFARLRRRLEREWVPAPYRLVNMSDAQAPVLWDADFLYGARTDSGTDTYVLCEINVSCVIPYPNAAPAKIAAAVKRRTQC